MESADVTPSASPGETGRYNTATIADFNGNISLKNISPRREGEIKKSLPTTRRDFESFGWGRKCCSIIHQ
jgi:hypothetical protein